MNRPAKFYDHAGNHTNANVGAAVARARQAAIDDGDAYSVAFTGPAGRFYWDGCRYDVLRLAKDMARIPGSEVEVTRPDGSKMGPKDVLSAGF